MVKEIQLKSVGVEALKGMYVEDDDFKEIYDFCKQPYGNANENYFDFLIQDVFLFKGHNFVY